MSLLWDIVSFLDGELNTAAFEDVSHNGLQVENRGKILRICAGVDASLSFFRQAARRNANLLVCHHGLSWGDSLKHITGLNYRRLGFLFDHDMALYACHLPLDAHPRLGNNAQICKALGLRGIKPFGVYRGNTIGWCGSLAGPMSYERFKQRVQTVFNRIPESMDFGKKKVRTVAVVSGAAAEGVAEAGAAGLDVYISGEPGLVAYHAAQEYGINAVFAGHYATEVFGVKALAALLAKKFAVKTDFIDMAVPF